MSFNRFSKLRNALHLVDITQRPDNNNDRLWKVRDLYNSILGRCRELPLETDLCVDEQMVPFKGQINIKQYIKNKPKKWGIKIFILAGKSGLVYDFLIYQGASTEIKKINKLLEVEQLQSCSWLKGSKQTKQDVTPCILITISVHTICFNI
jgi:hypothetical protein